MSETTLTSPSTITPLQSMLHELYSLRELFTNVSYTGNVAYTGSNAKVTFDTSWNVTFAANITTASNVAASNVKGTLGNGESMSARSGASGSYTTVGIGRTATELNVAISAGSNQFINGTAAGDSVIQTTGGKLFLGSGSTGAATVSGLNLVAGGDNVNTLGAVGNRWSVVYAATGTINTSDAREKTAASPMTQAEIAASKDLAREIGVFAWLASVAVKGAAARAHVGMTVQRAIEIMRGHGLDPMRYAFICHDSWDESEDGPAGDRYGFRYEQLNLFIARGFEARLAALEAAA